VRERLEACERHLKRLQLGNCLCDRLCRFLKILLWNKAIQQIDVRHPTVKPAIAKRCCEAQIVTAANRLNGR
jgi:hypothetical protein